MGFLSSFIKPATGQFGFIIKTADQSVVNSATLVNDSELFIALNANKRYFFIMLVYYTTTATGDFRMTTVLPTDATGTFMGATLRGFGSADGDVEAHDTVEVPNTSDTFVHHQMLSGKIITKGTAGNFQFQFAQGTSDATPTILLEGSSLIIWEES